MRVRLVLWVLFSAFAATATAAVLWRGSADAAAPAADIASPAGPMSSSAPGGVPAGAVQRTVIRVVDGDTLVLDGDEVVRLIGVDTPETKKPGVAVQCFGPEASQRLSTVAVGSVWVLADESQGDVDRYGRSLRHVWSASGVNVAEDLLAGGFARELLFGDPYLFRDRYVAAEQSARSAAAGLWGSCEPRFASCAEARAAGAGPFVAGRDAEYELFSDGDGDGVVCEAA